ncbi:MAG: hypothetical protein HOG79_16570 [Prolixibacteraceae bacterium]|nr:hypothetical protein [Prolixibacteraceae bacterium]
MKNILRFSIFIVISICCPFMSVSQLTGIWTDNGGATYRIRQIENQIFWSMDARPRVLNVFYGVIAGDVITGRWADVPDGRLNGSGTLALKVENQNRMVKLGSEGNYGATVWTRTGNNTTQGPDDPPINPPDPPTLTSSPNALKIPGAVDLAISNTDIWIGHGEYGIYRIPLSTRQPVTFDNTVMAKHIAVDQNNRPWIVSSDQIVYYHDGNTWIKPNPSQCKTICIDKNNVAWTIDYGWWVKYFDGSTQEWKAVVKMDGRAMEVIDKDNMIHVGSWDVYQFAHLKQNGGPWTPINKQKFLNDIAMSQKGIAWGISRGDDVVCKYENGKWANHTEYGKAERIAVSPTGEVYTIVKE